MNVDKKLNFYDNPKPRVLFFLPNAKHKPDKQMGNIDKLSYLLLICGFCASVGSLMVASVVFLKPKIINGLFAKHKKGKTWATYKTNSRWCSSFWCATCLRGSTPGAWKRLLSVSLWSCSWSSLWSLSLEQNEPRKFRCLQTKMDNHHVDVRPQQYTKAG